jgi:hypothetical protein
VFPYPNGEVTGNLADAHCATGVGDLVNANFLYGELLVNWSEMGRHFVQWFVSGVDPLFLSSLAVQSVLPLRIYTVISLIHFFHGVLVLLNCSGYYSDVLVNVTIGSENGCDWLQFRGLTALVTDCLLMY